MLDRKWVSVFAFWILILNIWPVNTLAMPSMSISVLQGGISRDAHMEKILSILGDPLARFHLQRVGIDESDLRMRLESLSDYEIARLADRAETVKAAGSTAVIVALVVVILILAWLYATNKAIDIRDR